MRHLRSRTRLVAGVAAASLVLVACGSEDEPTSTQTTPDAMDDPTDADPTETDDMGSMEEDTPADPYEAFRLAVQDVGPTGSAGALAQGLDVALNLEGDTTAPAAQVRVALTTLLQEHVYLAGAAVDAAFSFGADSAEFGLAAGALDKNSVELADLVGSVVPDQRDAFLGLWREHIGFFVDYAVGAVSGDDAAKQTALDSLDGYRDQAGQFFESITGGALPASAVSESLKGHIDTLAAAIDAAAAGDTQVWALLKAAADHVEGSATALTNGIVQAAGIAGDPESPASATLTTVSDLLEEHVFLAGFAVRAAYGAGGDLEDPSFQAAATELDNNSQAIAAVIGSVDADSEEPFLALWREHIGFFVDYAVAVAGNDEAGKQAALDALEGYGDQAGNFFEGLSGGVITTDAVKGSLAKHVDSTSATIRSFAAAILG